MLEDIINDDTPLYDNSSWKIKKREQLKNAYSIIESAVEEIKKNPQFLQTYWYVQSRFDRYTVRNSLLLAKHHFGSVPTVAHNISKCCGWPLLNQVL